MKTWKDKIQLNGVLIFAISLIICTVIICGKNFSRYKILSVEKTSDHQSGNSIILIDSLTGKTWHWVESTFSQPGFWMYDSFTNYKKIPNAPEDVEPK